MRHLRRFTVAIMALAAITATTAATAATAYANQAEGLLPAKTNFIGTGKGGKLLTLGGKEIKCEADSVTGSPETDSHGTGTITYEKCKAFGIFGINSLGDSSGTILIPGSGLLCLIEPKKLEFGIFTEPTAPIHLEAAGILVTLQGSYISSITPNVLSLRKTLTSTQKGGDLTVTSCTGVDGKIKTANLTLTEDKGTPESAALELTATEEAADKKTEGEIMDGN
jgi:hypothetical protein